MSNSIEKMLEISNRIEKATNNKQPVQKKTVSQHDLDMLIENYDQQVYGPVTETKQEDEPKYSARAEMERLKEIEANGGRSAVNLEGRNIPRNIVESILNNPLDMPPVVDSRMTALEEKIAEKHGGIQKAVDVMKRVDKKDAEAKAKLTEQLQPKTNIVSTTVDYELVKTIVESVLDKRLSELKEVINESHTTNTNTYVPSMKMLSFKDNFFFVDNDDNVFECVMKYKGKRKK